MYEELFIYHFEDGRTSNEGKNNYYLTWIPEGYTQILEDSVGNTSSVIYMNDEGEILKFIMQVRQMRHSGKSSQQILPLKR